MGQTDAWREWRCGYHRSGCVSKLLLFSNLSAVKSIRAGAARVSGFAFNGGWLKTLTLRIESMSAYSCDHMSCKPKLLTFRKSIRAGVARVSGFALGDNGG